MIEIPQVYRHTSYDRYDYASVSEDDFASLFLEKFWEKDLQTIHQDCENCDIDDKKSCEQGYDWVSWCFPEMQINFWLWVYQPYSEKECQKYDYDKTLSPIQHVHHFDFPLSFAIFRPLTLYILLSSHYKHAPFVEIEVKRAECEHNLELVYWQAEIYTSISIQVKVVVTIEIVHLVGRYQHQNVVN
jgi:hypothetical protein